MDEEKCRIPEREAADLGTYDVVIVGGGFPGVCAAVGAARAGAKVALIERDGLLGGQAAEIYTFGLDGFIDNSGSAFVKGIPWEVLQRTLAEGQSDPVWSRVDYERMEREGLSAEVARFGMSLRHFKSQTYVNPNAFRYVLQTMVEEEGIALLMESPVYDAMIEGNRVTGVVINGGYGPCVVKASVVVDTTPQALVAALAGKPFPHPEVYTGTHPRVAGVNVHQLLGYLEGHPEDVEVLGVDSGALENLRVLISKDMALLMRGFGKLRERAITDDPAYMATGWGEPPALTFFYDRDGCGTYWIRSDEWRYTRLDDHLHLSRAISEIRKRQWLTHKLFREYVPGFQRAHLVDIHPHIATALIRSKESGGFTEYDIPSGHIESDGELYTDSIVRVMGHPDAGQSPSGFQVPLRSLIPKGLEGMLVTGKPACRFLHYHCTNAAVGQAAGVAASVAAAEGVSLREIHIGRVQEELARQGAVVF